MVTPFSAYEYNNVVRTILSQSRERVAWLEAATEHTLRRLDVEPNLQQAETVIPEGSDQIDLGSIRDWMSRIGYEDQAALAQVIQLHATCAQRIEG